MTLKEKFFFCRIAEDALTEQYNSFLFVVKIVKKKRIIYFKNETVKNFVWIYFNGQKNETNFEEKNFHGSAKKLRNLRKLIARKLISANITLLKVFSYWKLKKVMQ